MRTFVQAVPNPDFGGSKADADALLRRVEGYFSLPPPCETVQRFVDLCSTAGADAACVDAAMSELPPSLYRSIPQGTPAWFALRQRIFITGSRLWDLSCLSLIPEGSLRCKGFETGCFIPEYRKGAHCAALLADAAPACATHNVQHAVFVPRCMGTATAYHVLLRAGEHAFAKSVLVARGELSDAFDKAALLEHEDLVGPVDNEGLMRSAVNMRFGIAKEGFGVAAGIRALAPVLSECMVQETGFTSCDSPDRCAYTCLIYCRRQCRPLRLRMASETRIVL